MPMPWATLRPFFLGKLDRAATRRKCPCGASTIRPVCRSFISPGWIIASSEVAKSKAADSSVWYRGNSTVGSSLLILTFILPFCHCDPERSRGRSNLLYLGLLRPPTSRRSPRLPTAGRQRQLKLVRSDFASQRRFLILVFRAFPFRVGLRRFRSKAFKQELADAHFRIDFYRHRPDIGNFEDEAAFPAGIEFSCRGVDDNAKPPQTGAPLQPPGEIIWNLH